MKINELEELREFNELDLLYKLIEVAEGTKKRAEQTIKDNNTAGVDVRHSMQDIKLLADIIRNKIQIRQGYFERENTKTNKKPPKVITYKNSEIPNNTLEKAIVDKNESLKKEFQKAKKAENLRKVRRVERPG